MQTCKVSGASKSCDVSLEKCPPCIFPKGSEFNCFEYDTETRATAQCPYVSTTTDYVDCCTSTMAMRAMNGDGLAWR